jgi:hypothetical protein
MVKSTRYHSTARLSVQRLGLAYLVGLLAALVVVVPERRYYPSTTIARQPKAFKALVERKRWALVVLVWTFGIGSDAFAELLVVLALGISPLAVSWLVDRGVVAARRPTPPLAPRRSAPTHRSRRRSRRNCIQRDAARVAL